MDLSNDFKKSKNLFKIFIKYINTNKIMLNECQKTHLQLLISKWRNDKDYTIDNYMDFKKNHHYINGTFETELLNKKWDAYLITFQEQRILTSFNLFKKTNNL